MLLLLSNDEDDDIVHVKIICDNIHLNSKMGMRGTRGDCYPLLGLHLFYISLLETSHASVQ